MRDRILENLADIGDVNSLPVLDENISNVDFYEYVELNRGVLLIDKNGNDVIEDDVNGFALGNDEVQALKTAIIVRRQALLEAAEAAAAVPPPVAGMGVDRANKIIAAIIRSAVANGFDMADWVHDTDRNWDNFRNNLAGLAYNKASINAQFPLSDIPDPHANDMTGNLMRQYLNIVNIPDPANRDDEAMDRYFDGLAPLLNAAPLPPPPPVPAPIAAPAIAAAPPGMGMTPEQANSIIRALRAQFLQSGGLAANAGNANPSDPDWNVVRNALTRQPFTGAGIDVALVGLGDNRIIGGATVADAKNYLQTPTMAALLDNAAIQSHIHTRILTPNNLVHRNTIIAEINSYREPLSPDQIRLLHNIATGNVTEIEGLLIVNRHTLGLAPEVDVQSLASVPSVVESIQAAARSKVIVIAGPVLQAQLARGTALTRERVGNAQRAITHPALIHALAEAGAPLDQANLANTNSILTENRHKIFDTATPYNLNESESKKNYDFVNKQQKSFSGRIDHFLEVTNLERYSVADSKKIIEVDDAVAEMKLSLTRYQKTLNDPGSSKSIEAQSNLDKISEIEANLVVINQQIIAGHTPDNRAVFQTWNTLTADEKKSITDVGAEGAVPLATANLQMEAFLGKGFQAGAYAVMGGVVGGQETKEIKAAINHEARFVPIDIRIPASSSLDGQQHTARTGTVQTVTATSATSYFGFQRPGAAPAGPAGVPAAVPGDEPVLFTHVKPITQTFGSATVPGVPYFEWASKNIKNLLAIAPDKTKPIHLYGETMDVNAVKAWNVYCEFKGIPYTPKDPSIREKHMRGSSELELFTKEWHKIHPEDLGKKEEAEIELKTTRRPGG